MSSSHPLRAILFAIAGFTFWVIGDCFMKLAGEQGAPSYEIMIVGGVGGLISIFIVTLMKSDLSQLRPRKIKALSVLGVLFFLSYICWLKALSYMPLANFYIFIFLSPTLVAFLASILLKEPLGWNKIIAIAVGFLGVVVAVNPTQFFDNFSEWSGYAAALTGMVVVVTQQLILRFMAPHESRESSAFYPRFGAILGGSIAIVFCGFYPLSTQAIIYSFLTGAIGSIGWVFMAHAYKIAPAATISPFHYSQIISGALIGYFVWHTVPTVHILVGAAIIILSGLYIVHHSNRAAKISNTLVDVP